MYIVDDYYSQSAHHKLKTFKEDDMVPNWDSYGADPITPTAIRVAYAILWLLLPFGKQIDVFPVPDGGVLITIWSLHIFVRDNGRLHFYRSHRCKRKRQ